jgi:hypothetical protein
MIGFIFYGWPIRVCFFGYGTCCIMYITCLDHNRIIIQVYFMCYWRLSSSSWPRTHVLFSNLFLIDLNSFFVLNDLRSVFDHWDMFIHRKIFYFIIFVCVGWLHGGLTIHGGAAGAMVMNHAPHQGELWIGPMVVPPWAAMGRNTTLGVVVSIPKGCLPLGM